LKTQNRCAQQNNQESECAYEMNHYWELRSLLR
jgi:hypothetical protein